MASLMYNMLHNFCCHSVTIQTAQRTSTDSELGPDLFSGYSETAILNPTFYKVYKNHTRPLKIQYKSLWPIRQSYTEELIRPLNYWEYGSWILQGYIKVETWCHEGETNAKIWVICRGDWRVWTVCGGRCSGKRQHLQKSTMPGHCASLWTIASANRNRQVMSHVHCWPCLDG